MPELTNNQKVLDYIKRTGTLVAEAEKQAATKAQQDSKVAALIPAAVDALIENGRIPEELRDKAAASLNDHSKALEVLTSVAAHRTDAELSHLGTGVKNASAKRESPYVGAREQTDRESDRLLFERFGIRV